MKNASILLSAITLSVMAFSATGADFGDHSSATLTGKAWEQMLAGNLEEALIYVNKCKEMYEAEAIKQQANLTAFAPKDKAHDYWALNDVGTCYFIHNQILEKQGNSSERLVVLRKLATQFKFSQCWDTKGWFWHPAEAAATLVKQLEFDSVLDD